MFYKTVLIALMTLLSANIAFADTIDEAQAAFKKGDYEHAAKKFLESEIEEPDELKHAYNRAVSQYLNKNFEQAESGFRKSMQSKDKNLSKHSKFNLGNTLASKGNFEEAKKIYEEILKEHPQDQPAKANKDWVEKMIEEMKKQEQQNKDQKNQDEQNKDEQNKDEQNKDQQNQNEQNNDQQNQDQQNQNEQNQDQQNQNEQNQDQKDQNQKSEEEEEKNKPQEAGKESENENKDSQQEEGGDTETSPSQQELTREQQELDKRSAEKLLQKIEDSEEYFAKPPKINIPNQRPERDW